MRLVSERPLLVLAVAVAVLVATIGVLATAGPTGPSAATDGATLPPNATGVSGIHAVGITGEGVSVGVVDVTGFDTDHPALRGQVADTRSFAPGETVENGGLNDHGTAAASIVAGVAPGSNLYLASFDDADGYEAALEWLQTEDVDVVVVPVSFYGKPDDGDSRVSQVAERAAENGTVVVAPVGNLARGHWEGRYRPVGEGVHRFDDGTRNYLRSADAPRVQLWLSWDRAHRDADFTAELYWTNGTAHRLVARSQPYRADDAPNERIVARLENGSYYVRVTGPANATDARIALDSPTHALQFRSRAGSIAAPATTPGVVSVGAYDRDAERVRPFSSAGPTSDGRVGVDVVAPDGLPAATAPAGFQGSSAAAPYVAGTVALVLDGSDRQPRRTERLLERTAEDLRQPGPDVVSGYGLVRPARTVRTAQTDSNQD